MGVWHYYFILNEIPVVVAIMDVLFNKILL